MLSQIIKLCVKYKELIMYGIFGVGATVINIVSFYIFNNIFHIQFLVSNILAWICAFIFAFLTNKLWVFESKSWTGSVAVKEMINFFLVRLGTGILDTALMFLFVIILSWNEMISKIFVNILVIIINYVASKFWVFRNSKRGSV